VETEESERSVTLPPVPAENPVEATGCKVCGAEPEPGLPLSLCSNCRTKLARRPIPIGIKVAGALVGLLIILALTRIPTSMPIVGIIYLATIGRFFWLDLFYGIGVDGGLPTLVVAIYSSFV
jgi:hypothetical protein